MIGFVLYVVLAVAAWRWCGSGVPSSLGIARTGAFTIAAPALILSATAAVGLDSGPWAGPAVLIGLIAISLVLGARTDSVPGASTRTALETMSLALAVALVCPRIGIGPETVALDGMAHLAWSRDLVGASPFYVLGFPAFTATLTPGDSLIGAFRVAPALLALSLFAQILALGRAAGSVLAGLGGCLLLLAMPLLQARLYPALPELMACTLIFAGWVEVLSQDRSTARSAFWMAFLVCALTVIHVSTLEIVHLIALGLAVVVAPARRIAARFVVLGAMAAGVVVGVLCSPMLMAMIGGKGLLLVDEQPSFLTPFSLRRLAAGWGIAVDLALVGGVVLGLMVWRDLRSRVPVLLGLFVASAVLILPTLLAAVGIHVPVQVFTSRLYIAASYFVIAAWVIALASGSAKHPRIAGLLAILPAVGVFLRLRTSEEHLMIASVSAAFVLGVAWAIRRSIRHVVALSVAMLLLLVPARLWIWLPEDPGWVRFLVAHQPTNTVLLTHWPAFNQAQARAPFPVEVGLAGADAQLPLHALERIPELRNRLRWSAASVESDRTAILEWVREKETPDVLILVHRNVRRAWDGYARTWGRRQADALDPGAAVYGAQPVGETVESRLRHMEGVLRSLPSSELVFEDSETMIFRLSPPALRGDSRS